MTLRWSFGKLCYLSDRLKIYNTQISVNDIFGKLFPNFGKIVVPYTLKEMSKLNT